MAGDGNKTEKPTPQRLKKAREKGQFLSARGMITAVEFIAALVLLSNWLPGWMTQMQGIAGGFLQTAMSGEMADSQWLKILGDLFRQSLVPVCYFGGALLALVAAVNLG